MTLAALLCLVALSAAGGQPGEAADPGAARPGTETAPEPRIVLQPLTSLQVPAAFSRFVPERLALDGLGRLFVLDASAGRIARILPAGTWTLFGVGEQGGERFPDLASIFARWGTDLFALDRTQRVLYQFDLDGHLRARLAYGDDLPEELAFGRPADFALSRTGELLLLDGLGARLLLFDRFGRFQTDLAVGMTTPMEAPTRLVQDAEGACFVLDPAAGAIHRFGRQGIPLSSWTYHVPTQTKRSSPLACVTPWNQLLLVGGRGGWLLAFTPEGASRLLTLPAAEQDALELASAVMAPDSILYMACPQAREIRRWKWRDGGESGR